MNGYPARPARAEDSEGTRGVMNVEDIAEGCDAGKGRICTCAETCREKSVDKCGEYAIFRPEGKQLTARQGGGNEFARVGSQVVSGKRNEA